jgi:hypothetical protein
VVLYLREEYGMGVAMTIVFILAIVVAVGGPFLCFWLVDRLEERKCKRRK